MVVAIPGNSLANDGIASVFTEGRDMLYLTTLLVLVVIVDSIHALGSPAG